MRLGMDRWVNLRGIAVHDRDVLQKDLVIESSVAWSGASLSKFRQLGTNSLVFRAEIGGAAFRIRSCPPSEKDTVNLTLKGRYTSKRLRQGSSGGLSCL